MKFSRPYWFLLTILIVVLTFSVISGSQIRKEGFREGVANNSMNKLVVKPQTKPYDKPQTKPYDKPQTKPYDKPQTKPYDKPQTKPPTRPMANDKPPPKLVNASKK